MAYSRLIFTLYILLMVLLVEIATGVDPLECFCSHDEDFIVNSKYESSLSQLLDNLRSFTSATGFAQDHVPVVFSPVEAAFGLSQCQGNISSTNCTLCVTEASAEVRELCPNNKGAIIWYDNCLLKFSNFNFFGEFNDQTFYSKWDFYNSSDPKTFERKKNELLKQLVQEAPVQPFMFATGSINVRGSEDLYGMAQCTNDLSELVCKNCLVGLIDQMHIIGREASLGGQIGSGSCRIRYEVFSFF